MKKILKILGFIILSIVILLSLIFGISTLIPIDETLTLEAKSTTNANASTKTSSHKEIRLISMLHLGAKMWQPIAENDVEVYCIAPGTPIAKARATGTDYSNYYTHADISNIVNNTDDSNERRCRCARHVDTYQKYYSDTYYVCKGLDYTETSSGTGPANYKFDNLYNVAYIVSYKYETRSDDSKEAWSIRKQQAIWQSPELVDQAIYNKYAPGSEGIAEGKSLKQQGDLYQEFYEKIMEKETDKTSDSYGQTGVKPNSLTDNEKVVLNIDKEENIAKIGPFKINYVSGYQHQESILAGSSFGGISDMYLLDGEGNKILIKNLIVEGKLRKVYNKGDDRLNYTFFSNWDKLLNNGKGAENRNCVDYFASYKAYPQPEQEFYVEFELPEKLVGGVKLHIEFSYLKCEMELCVTEAGQYYVDDYCKGEYTSHYHTDDEGHRESCITCKGRRAKVGWTHNSQDGVHVVSYSRELVKEEYDLTNDGDLFTTSMKVGGFVFEDVFGGKDNTSDGQLNQSNNEETDDEEADGQITQTDKRLKNVEVTLYTVEDDSTLKLAELATLVQEKPTILKKSESEQAEILNDPNDYTRRTNPTLTDENGYYEFRGVDSTKNYVVKFTYNGQTYMPTQYLQGSSGTNVAEMVTNGEYSSATTSEIWNATSKATEDNNERIEYDNKFKSIGSTPTNYESGNSLNKLDKISGKYYNEVYTIYELAGFTMGADGKYVYDEKNQLIDSCYTLKDGIIDENGEFKEGKVSIAVRKYIEENHKYPEKMEDAYASIAGDDKTIWKKLQFIEDCKISAYSKNQESTLEDLTTWDQYPVYKYFTTAVAEGNRYPDNSYQDGTYASGVTTYMNTTLKANGVKGDALDTGSDVSKYGGKYAKSKGQLVFDNVYEGQLFINCGLWARQKSDMALRKDVYKATIKINGKTETYQYDKRNEKDYWEIKARLDDYDSYYGGEYVRALYPSDYNYTGNNKLEVYITYKITIRNQSQEILTQIDEIVDYYDNTYTYMDKYSWVMYDDVKLTNDEYYNILSDETSVGSGKFKDAIADEVSIYPSKSEYEIEGYNSLYVNGLSGKKLKSGEDGYVYLTFKVNETANKVDLGTKHNIAEINGYTTYYKDGTQLPNGVEKNSKDYAGIIDFDSKPGNFNGPTTNKFEYIFEDDTDHAKGIRVFVDSNLIRTISGIVWEDKRDTTPTGTDAYIGNGIRDDGETLVQGIKVEMYEVLSNGTLQKPTTTQSSTMKTDTMETKNDGSYNFEGFIPGNYIIRFTYGGDVSATAQGYNGQDFKSTTYQVGINQSGQTNLGNDCTYWAYTDTEKQNETATYGYDINKADSASKNYSDAKDIWSSNSTASREKVDQYSSNNYKGVTNELATTLADYKKQNANTQMVAETGVIAIEGEYNRVNSDKDENSNNGYNNINYINGNDKNGSYNITNVDFGLQERPKAQLELNKQVSHIKITLANQNVLFDADKSVDNLVWQPKTEYNLTSEQVNNYYKTYNNYDNFRADILKRVQEIAVNKKGLIQPTMDKELTHGATIQITYDITVTNVGEVDYKDKSFYYTGKVKDTSTIVTTSADLLVDYVENNLKFRDANNKTEWGWKSTSNDTLKTNKYLTSQVEKELTNYNTIITTESLNKKLIPLTSSTKNNSNTYTKTQLILAQTITAQNDQDDMVYNNTSEIIKISNDVGRRMAFSVQGNQKPSESPQEPDASVAEEVVILPPFGDTYLYFGLGIVIVAILAGAVIIIKKKVLNK